MDKKALCTSALLAFTIIALGCSPETSTPTETLAPTEERVQPTEAKRTTPIPETSEATEPPLEPTTAPPSEIPPPIDYQNAIPHYPAGTKIELTSITMADSTTGWAVGLKAGDSDHILRTEDGGLTWWDVTPPETNPPAGESIRAQAFFLDQSTAWVSYSLYEIVWRTTDAGITWLPAQVPMAGNLGASLWFLDAETGWMMKYLDAGMNHVYCALFRTTSGGRYWEKVFDPYSDGGVQSFSKTGLIFADVNTGWITRDPQGVMPGAFVDATSDGGYTWEMKDLPPPANEPEKFNQEYCGMFEPVLFSASSGAVVVTCRRYDDGERVETHFLLRTLDAGSTWTLYDYPGGDLVYVTQNAAYALGRDIYKSSNGGKSWTKIKQVNWDGQFSFVNENFALAVARAGEEIALVTTTDGCRTFTEIEPQVIDPPASYTSVAPSTSPEVDPASIGGGSRQIAFISYRDNADQYDTDIYLMNIDGSGLSEITDSTGSIYHFSWSPDGQRLAFDSDRDGDSEIYVIQVDGSGLTQLTFNSIDDTDPDWSPNGLKIAYVVGEEDKDAIYLMNPDGSTAQYLVDGRTPAWSPDGSKIAFSRIKDGIYVINADGSNLSRLTDSTRYDFDHYPVWSPDGSLILFGSNRHQPEWGAAESVYVMRADGSGIGRLTEAWGKPPYAWSPDGQWIIYTNSFGSVAQLFIMDAQGFQVRPLMEDNYGFHPLWRP